MTGYTQSERDLPKMGKLFPFTALAIGLCVVVDASVARAYPTDEYERTKIRRLDWQRKVDAGERRGLKVPLGARWPASRIKLRMLDARDFRLTGDTPKDPALQAGLTAIMKKGSFRNYNIAVLDISDPQHPRYAAVNETEMLTPGSVAKVLVGAGLYQALRDRYPNDIAAREALLRDTMITADEWAMPNSHEVPVINGESVAIRKMLRGDVFSLWEWVDHMLSPSSNAAATTVWREATLMRLLGQEYPPPRYDDALFARWDKPTFSAAAFQVVDQPLIDAGIDPESFKLRLFFTKGPSKYLDSGDCRVSPLALLQWMLAVEQGRMVDEYSSLELKKMLYLTRRRVRYAQAPELAGAAVFFKSGSLFQCKPEEGFVCIQYQGNVVNVLNALVEVEAPALTTAAAAAPGAATATGPVATIAALDVVRAAAAGDATAGGGAAPAGAASPPGTQPAPSVAGEPTAASPTSTTPATTMTAAGGAPATSAPAADDAPPLVYLVALMSNELKRNAAEDHAKLASSLHELLKRR